MDNEAMNPNATDETTDAAAQPADVASDEVVMDADAEAGSEETASDASAE